MYKEKWLIGIGIVFIICIVLGLLKGKQTYLTLESEDGKPYLEIEIEENQAFSIEFIHSVNQSPVIDYYEVREDSIYVVATKYYDFGAGVQSQIEEGQTLSYTEDGGMLVSGFYTKLEPLVYVVAKVSDHILRVGEAIYSLRDICGSGAYVEFEIKKKSIVWEVVHFVR